jgi:hypothetical protein
MLIVLDPPSLDPTEDMPMSTVLDPTDGMPMLTSLDPPSLDPTEDMPMSTALDSDPTDGMAFLTAPDPAESMAFLTTPDPTAGPVEVGRLTVPGSEDDLNLCPNYQVGATDWSLATETSETRIQTSRTRPKETSSRPTTRSSPYESCCGMTSSLNHSRLSTIPSNKSRNQSRLSALGSSEDSEWHLNLCPMASYVLAPAGPLAKPGGESCPSALGSSEERHLPMGSYYELAPAGPLAKDESCPSLSALGSAEERYLNLCPEELHLNLCPIAATLGHAASAAPTDSQSLTTPGSAACSSCLLRSPTMHPMGSNAPGTQLPRLHPPHRRALHVSLVLIQEPRVRS